MGSLTTEVMGKFDGRGDADKLVYTPIGGGATYQQTRVYDLEYELSLIHISEPTRP